MLIHIPDRDIKFKNLKNNLYQSVSSAADVRPTSSRQTKILSRKWKKLTSDPQTLDLVDGYQILFSSEPKQTKPPNPVHLTKKEESLV